MCLLQTSGMCSLQLFLLIQSFLVNGDGILQGFFLRRACLQFQADGITVFRDLSHLFFQLCILFFQAFIAICDLLFFGIHGLQVHAHCVVPQVLFLQKLSQTGHLVTEVVPLLPMTVQFRLLLLQILFQHFHTVSELVDFPPAPQQVAVILKGTACQGTAWIQRFPLNGHHPDGILIFPGNGDTVVNMVHHQGSAQQVIGKPFIFRIHSHQLTGNPDDARLFQGRGIGKGLFIFHAGKGQERGTAIFVPFQEGDQFLGCALIVCNYVLDTAAQGSLDGCLIILLDFDQIRHNTPDARDIFLLLHDTADAVAVSVVALRDVLQGFQAGSLPVISCLSHIQLSAGFGDQRLTAFYLILAVIALSGELFYVLLYLLLLFFIALFGVPLLACLTFQAQELLV